MSNASLWTYNPLPTDRLTHIPIHPHTRPLTTHTVRNRYPHALIQFEDFSSDVAYDILNCYRKVRARCLSLLVCGCRCRSGPTI